MDDETRAQFGEMRAQFGELRAQFGEVRERFERLEALMQRFAEGQLKLRTDLMARMDRLQDAASRDREDVRLASGAAQAAHKSALQLLEMTTVLHRRLTNAEQTIEDLRKPPEAA